MTADEIMEAWDEYGEVLDMLSGGQEF